MSGNSGYAYVLSNPSMPGLVKVGRSKVSGHKRANELYVTGVPTPFRLEAEFYSDDCHEAEETAHGRLGRYLVSESREFFKCEAVTAIAAIVGAVYEGNEIQRVDFIVDECDLSFITENVNRKFSTDFVIPTVSSAMLSVDPRAILDAINFVATRRASRLSLISEG